MNYAVSQEHLPLAEYNNQMIQERMLASYHRFTCDHLPRIMVKYMVLEAAKKLDFYPNKNGVSKN